jgi:hypothetical protein
MEIEDIIARNTNYVYEKGNIEIPYGIVYDKNDPNKLSGFCKINDKNSIASQATSKEELQEKMKDALERNFKFYQKQSLKLNQRAIWLSNFNKHDGGFAFWFSIVGLGLNIVYSSKRAFPPRDKNNKPIKYLGINKAGGLVIKNLIIFANNSWRIKH